MWRGPTLGPRPCFCGTTQAVCVGPTLGLGPKSWSPRGPSFHTGNRACGTTVVLALYLGRGPARGPSTTPPWDHTLVLHRGPGPGAEGRPRAPRRGGGYGPLGRAHGRPQTMTRPPSSSPGSRGPNRGRGTVAGNTHMTRAPRATNRLLRTSASLDVLNRDISCDWVKFRRQVWPGRSSGQWLPPACRNKDATPRLRAGRPG